MRIAQTTDGRYVKVLSPQFQGMIGRMYQEVKERKEQGETFSEKFIDHENKMLLMTDQIDTMQIRYNEISSTVNQMFPENELVAVIDRPLRIEGDIRGTAFHSTTVVEPPMTVLSSLMVNNLNAHYIGGVDLAGLTAVMDEKDSALNAFLLAEIRDVETRTKAGYAPISHINAAGVGVHPYADYSLGGFMSPVDKKWIDDTRDNLAEELVKIENTGNIILPAGIILSDTTPSSPVRNMVWIDTTDDEAAAPPPPTGEEIILDGGTF